MPGPVSDSFDPEWTTSDNRDAIEEALKRVYGRLSRVLDNAEPVHAIALAHDYHDSGAGGMRNLTLGEREIRLCRFAIERAIDSL